MTTRIQREKTFQDIYTHHLWGGISRSGTGSDLSQTEIIRYHLPILIREYGIHSLLDLPCGDLHWMQTLHSVFHPSPPIPPLRYIGADIVPPLIHHNQFLYPDKEFLIMDAVTTTPPKVDLILMRDFLGHLPNEDVTRVIRKLRRSESRYLLATNFPHVPTPIDIPTGSWRPINLAFFGLRPILSIDESPPSTSIGKMLSLYELTPIDHADD